METKDKQNILKAATEIQTFSSKKQQYDCLTFQQKLQKSEDNDILKVLKENNPNPNQDVKISCKNKVKMKVFPDK